MRDDDKKLINIGCIVLWAVIYTVKIAIQRSNTEAAVDSEIASENFRHFASKTLK